ncbi:MAG: isopentenyl-diphosphate Delta-isomerase [Candidatus Aenigmarchaeota archaeon]
MNNMIQEDETQAKEEIILVDEEDKPIGSEEKIKAHEDGGKLHRAFSIIIFNSRGQMLLQLRARKKHHFGGLWTNACCSHPRKGEDLETAVHRKLKQELGFDTDLKELFKFTYKATDPGSSLTEHEIDHVFLGTYDSDIKPNPDEVDELKWADTDELKRDIEAHPEKYSPWFKILIDRVLEAVKS